MKKNQEKIPGHKRRRLQHWQDVIRQDENAWQASGTT